MIFDIGNVFQRVPVGVNQTFETSNFGCVDVCVELPVNRWYMVRMHGPRAFEQIQTTKIFARNGRHSNRQSIGPIFLAIPSEQMICLPANLPYAYMGKRSHRPKPMTIISSKRIGKWHRRQRQNYPQLVFLIFVRHRCSSILLFETHNLCSQHHYEIEKRVEQALDT